MDGDRSEHKNVKCQKDYNKCNLVEQRTRGGNDIGHETKRRDLES